MTHVENKHGSFKFEFPELYHKNSRCIKIGISTLNQLSMDFKGNQQRIIKSIQQCKDNNCTVRIGPELEICGYSCQDHYLEGDTILHSWQVIGDIIKTGIGDNILLDLGAPVEWHGTVYNCRIFIYQKKIILVRPKASLADDGLYREGRWFTSWKLGYKLYEFKLPHFIQEITGESYTKIGMGIINFNDCSFASEICEELWDPKNPSTDFALNGAEVIINNSGSHFGIDKNKTRVDFLKSTSRKNGGCYIYCNLTGCDGERMVFDGINYAYLNNELILESKPFSYYDVDTSYIVVDLDEIAKYRSSIRSRCVSSNSASNIDSIVVKSSLCSFHNENKFSDPIKIYREFSVNSQIYYSTSYFLWDYLRKSGGSGFFLPLSGGADSSSVAIIVSNLCRILYNEVLNENQFVIAELKKVVKDPSFLPSSPKEICSRILFTAYLGSKFSSKETRYSASSLAEEIGSNHMEVDIDEIYISFLNSIKTSINFSPKFQNQGGSITEDLSLQNLQSRIRMVMSYLLSQISPLLNKSNTEKPGFLLVLASGNLDESMLGYLTKYDCSSGDINPIGSLSKIKIKEFLLYCHKEHNYKSLENVLKLEPSAELRPFDVNNEKSKQTDEEDMGFTYIELEILGMIRKEKMCGPFSMFKRMKKMNPSQSNEELRNKVKKYFFKYACNRHKVTTLTPSLYLDVNCNDDNRFDLRPFLYDPNFEYQFEKIDAFIKEEENSVVFTKI